MIKNAHYDKQNTCIERTKYMANDNYRYSEQTLGERTQANR